jgi:hypothetical protein
MKVLKDQRKKITLIHSVLFYGSEVFVFWHPLFQNRGWFFVFWHPLAHQAQGIRRFGLRYPKSCAYVPHSGGPRKRNGEERAVRHTANGIQSSYLRTWVTDPRNQYHRVVLKVASLSDSLQSSVHSFRLFPIRVLLLPRPPGVCARVGSCCSFDPSSFVGRCSSSYAAPSSVPLS